MASNRKKDTYGPESTPQSGASSALKLGLIAASSALAGGLAAAWWYRKTLTKLQNPILLDDIQKTGLSDGLSGEGLPDDDNIYDDFSKS